MKIAYISTYLPVQCGIATYMDYLIRGIQEVEPSPDIRIIAEQGAQEVRGDGIEVIPCWHREQDYVKPILEQVKGADVVHIQHEYSIYKLDERLPTLLSQLEPFVKKVVTIHCIRPSQFSERGAVEENFIRRIAQLADHVIVHLETQREILHRLGVTKDVEVIPHGTELNDVGQGEARRRLELPQRGKILLMFGFVKRHKCIHIALEALCMMLERVKDVCLFIAGEIAPTASEKEREYVAHVEERIKELGLQGNVIYPNRFFPNEDVPYLFGAVDIVLFPYYEEDRSTSGSFHLAVGAKKPVIASRIPKFEELKDICDELLVLPYNPSGIARIALRLFEEPEFTRYVLNKTERFRQRTSWQAVAKKHLELYGR